MDNDCEQFVNDGVLDVSKISIETARDYSEKLADILSDYPQHAQLSTAASADSTNNVESVSNQRERITYPTYSGNPV